MSGRGWSLAARLLLALPGIAAICALGAPSSAAGQQSEGLRFTVGASGGWAEVRTVDPEGDERSLTGVIGGVEGRISYWRFEGALEYEEGRLGEEAGGGRDLDVVTGEATVGFQVLPRVTLQGGPRAITLVGPDGDENLLAWRLGASVSLPLVPGLAEGFGTFSGTVAGSSPDRGALTKGGGGEVGVEVTPLPIPFSVGLGYRLHRELLSGSASQSAETIYLVVAMTFG